MAKVNSNLVRASRTEFGFEQVAGSQHLPYPPRRACLFTAFFQNAHPGSLMRVAAERKLNQTRESVAAHLASGYALRQAKSYCQIFTAHRPRGFQLLYEMAIGALSYFQHAGINVPRDVSVIGYDDTDTAAFSAPRLSTVHIAWREMTMNGLSYLLNSCYDLDRPVQRQFPVSVTWRSSVAKLVKAGRKV